MAPVIARSLQRGLSQNGPQFGGDVPPSTFAARIVHKYGDERTRNTIESLPPIRQLLREILEADQRGETDGYGVEPSLEINYKLLYVVARAGLVKVQGSPFDDKSQQQALALESLKIVDLTIRRLPKVLFEVPTDQRIKPGGPLYLWLLPIVINLVDLKTEASIQKEALKALQTSQSVPGPRFSIKQTLSTAERYLRGCINGESKGRGGPSKS
jgi:hypothetical protein